MRRKMSSLRENSDIIFRFLLRRKCLHDISKTREYCLLFKYLKYFPAIFEFNGLYCINENKFK